MRLSPTIIFAIAFACSIGCKKAERSLEAGTSRGLTPIHLKFGPPQFIIQPKDDGLAERTKRVTDNLLIKEAVIDTLAKDEKGTLWICDSREEFAYCFREQNISIEALRRMTGRQIVAFFGVSPRGRTREDGVLIWDVFNGQPGKRLRACQVVAGFTPQQEITFLCVNCGEPTP